MTLPDYELFAIRYAHRPARRRDHFMIGDPHDGPMDMDYFIWVAKGPDKNFVIDLGFSEETAGRRNRQLLRCPVQSLRLVGIEPDAVSDVIITHMHYDHAGNFKLVPNATIHMQEPEIHMAVGRHIRHPFLAHGYEVEDVIDVVRANFDKRLLLYTDRADLAPGLSIEPTPGHTPGQQVVRVHTKRGWVLLTSDASHYYENIRSGRPYPATANLPELLESNEKIMALADGRFDRLVPGHDPLVLQMYPPLSEDLRGAVHRLDVEPNMHVFDAHWQSQQ